MTPLVLVIVLLFIFIVVYVLFHKPKKEFVGGLSAPFVHTNTIGTCLFDSIANTLFNSTRITNEILSIPDNDVIDLSDKSTIYDNVLNHWILNPLKVFESKLSYRTFALITPNCEVSFPNMVEMNNFIRDYPGSIHVTYDEDMFKVRMNAINNEVLFKKYEDLVNYKRTHPNLIEAIDYKQLIRLFVSRYLRFNTAFAHTIGEYAGIEEGVARMPMTGNVIQKYSEDGRPLWYIPSEQGERKRVFYTNDYVRKTMYGDNKYVYITNKFANLIWSCAIVLYRRPKINMTFEDIMKVILYKDDVLSTSLFDDRNFLSLDGYGNMYRIYTLFCNDIYTLDVMNNAFKLLIEKFKSHLYRISETGDMFLDLDDNNLNMINTLEDLFNDKNNKARLDLIKLATTVLISKNHLMLLTDVTLRTVAHSIYYDILNNIISDNNRRFFYPIEYITHNINHILNAINKVLPTGLFSANNVVDGYMPKILHYQIFHLTDDEMKSVREKLPRFINVINLDNDFNNVYPSIDNTTVSKYLDINNAGLYAQKMSDVTLLLMKIEHKFVKRESALFKRHQKNIEQLQSSILSPYSKNISIAEYSSNIENGDYYSIVNNINFNDQLISQHMVLNINLPAFNTTCSILAVYIYNMPVRREEFVIYLNDTLNKDLICSKDPSVFGGPLPDSIRYKCDDLAFSMAPRRSLFTIIFIRAKISRSTTYSVTLHIYMFLRRFNVRVTYIKRNGNTNSYSVEVLGMYNEGYINSILQNNDWEFSAKSSTFTKEDNIQAVFRPYQLTPPATLVFPPIRKNTQPPPLVLPA